MDIDVSTLTFKDASKEEKKRIFRAMNLRSTIWLVCSIVAIALLFIVANGRLTWISTVGIGIALVILIYVAISDMPAWHCKVCHGRVSNKREVSDSEDTGLYYDAVTFISENGETMDAMPVFSAHTLHLLEEGSRATIVCYNKRQPVIFADKQLHIEEA
ncbi:MAG: hypothetical protein K6E26_07675 [Clostridiales bacterium]|nr:hypothetical protein [Clostridiales bacterium]MCR5275227.1 hypothetical protein [Clostridiales bacterium]